MPPTYPNLTDRDAWTQPSGVHDAHSKETAVRPEYFGGS